MSGVIENGHLVRILGTQRDVTQWKRAAEEIRNVTRHARCILYYANVEGKQGWQQDLEGRERRFTWEIVVPDETVAQRVLPLELKSGQSYWDAWKRQRHPEDLPQMARTA